MHQEIKGVISLPKSQFTHRIVLGIVAATIALLAVALPIHQADAALMDRVNEAIRTAGAPVIAERSSAFQAGVLKAHYLTFDQLVGAIIWHKDNGTLPSFTAVVAPVATSCISGDVISLAFDSSAATGSIVVEGDVVYLDGSYTSSPRTLNLATNQNSILVERGVVIGSNVDACWADSNPKALYGHVTLN